MSRKQKIDGLVRLGEWLGAELEAPSEMFMEMLRRAGEQNAWFREDQVRLSLGTWVETLTKEKLETWLKIYPEVKEPKKVGLILAGNLPAVGWHDVISVLLSGHIALVKQSSKDQIILPVLVNKWEEFCTEKLNVNFVEKLEGHQAVIATGSNNTARYLEYYFKNVPHIIRKNRTSVAVLDREMTKEEVRDLGKDIFQYFGQGCRNVSYLLIPQDMDLKILFETWADYSDIINHHKYANNYDYNRAIYLLNGEEFWDNNFVMLKESDQVFSPLSVVHFRRYEDLQEVKEILNKNQEHIQAVIAAEGLGLENSVGYGKAQCPGLSTYADGVDTMAFLQRL